MEQRSNEWHEMRSRHIGSSDAGVIMGFGFEKTIRDLWLEKLGLKECFKGNHHTERGIRLEDPALLFAERELGIPFKPVVKKHKNISYMMASLDGYNEDNNIVLEIKCPEKELHNEVKDYYFPQLMHQCEVVRPYKTFYMSYVEYNGVPKAKIIEVRRDDAYIEKLLEAEEKFWYYVTNCIEPPSKYDDYDNRNDSEYTEKLMVYLNNKEKAKFWADLEARSKDELIKMTNKPTISMGCKINEVVRSGAVDMKRLIADYGITNIQDYRQKPVKFWKIDKYKDKDE